MFRKKPFFFYKKNNIATLLTPFSWFYLFCFFILNIRFLKPKKICRKTICIGNIVVGGSGKTPICMAIFKAFSKYCNDICFITKGYGRKSNKNYVIPHEFKKMFNVDEVGDEAILLSDYADVFVLNERAKAKCHEYDLAICDDGFFDKSFYKDCKIVVFDGNFFIGNGKVLPAGPLRNRLFFLKNADFVIITDFNKKKSDKYFSILEKYIQKERILTAKLVLKSKHDLEKKYFAFSGIGENGKFIKNVRKYNINVVKFVGFEDHNDYNEETLCKLNSMFAESGADRIITTSKDYIKLPLDFITNNNVEVFDIYYEIADLDKIVSFVLSDKHDFNE